MLENSVFHITRKTPAIDLPVTLSEVKSFLGGINNNKEDELLKSLISISAEYAQWYMERSLTKQKWVLSYQGKRMPKKIYLPFGPLISVLSVEVLGRGNNFSVIDSKKYFVDVSQSLIVFPIMLNSSRIEITYESGYVDRKDIPMQVKHGILHHVAVAYKNRDSMNVNHLTFIKEIYLPFREVRLVL